MAEATAQGKEPAAWPQGLGRVILDVTGSTNAHALEMAPMCPGPCWFLAREQTAGRGRRARAWASPRGNFHASLLLHPAVAPDQAALRSFVAALALHEALAQLVPAGTGLGLKWPNDVLLDGGKVAGILLESRAGPGGLVRHLAIGIGVNLIAHPDADQVEAGALRPVSLLSRTGVHVTPEAFLDRLAPALERWEARLSGEGFAPLRAAFLAHAVRLGQEIVARGGKESWKGLFETIDLQGNLILRQPEGPRAISAADIFF